MQARSRAVELAVAEAAEVPSAVLGAPTACMRSQANGAAARDSKPALEEAAAVALIGRDDVQRACLLAELTIQAEAEPAPGNMGSSPPAASNALAPGLAPRRVQLRLTLPREFVRCSTSALAVQVDVCASQPALAACLKPFRAAWDTLARALQREAGAQLRSVPVAAPPQSSPGCTKPGALARCCSADAAPRREPLHHCPSAVPPTNNEPTPSRASESVWRSIAPPSDVHAAAAALGPIPTGVDWSQTRLLFLGTGSSEPSKYRGPSAMWLQVSVAVQRVRAVSCRCVGLGGRCAAGLVA